jgi:tRNA/tmRNA/rRNA uracil-C5-methylase (TrmA/RlmC/RlmD family)
VDADQGDADQGGAPIGRPDAVDELIRLDVGPVAHGGHCVARYEGRVVFVRHTLPGETVLARLTEAGEGAKFWRADAVEVLTASPDRVTPPCPWSGPGRCGGCDWQHAAPSAQRELKAGVITEQLIRLAGLEPGQDGRPEVVVEAVDGAQSGEGLGWRTRVRFAVDSRGRAGLRRHRSHQVVLLDWCRIAVPAVNDLEVTGARWPGVDAVEVVAPASFPEKERLVVVEPAPGRRGDQLRLPRLPVEASVATRDDAGLHRVRGRTWVAEQVTVDGTDRGFRITGGGFWQVHPGAAQTLLDAVMDAARPQPGERALDLYSGVGLFSAGLAARVGVTGSVLAVESQPRAVKDARRSLHDLPQVRFEIGRVDRVLARGDLEWTDVVVLDPPRSGAGKSVITRVAALTPRVIVYVACDPAALARDLATATAAGYRLTGLRAFDLFPMTHHVECVATLVRA